MCLIEIILHGIFINNYYYIIKVTSKRDNIYSRDNIYLNKHTYNENIIIFFKIIEKGQTHMLSYSSHVRDQRCNVDGNEYSFHHV